MHKILTALAGAALALTLAIAPASAEFPNGPVRIVVPYPAGGSTDVSARIIADKMSQILNSAVVIENRPGGATMTGTATVVNARPDGQTVLYAGPATILTPYLQQAVQFNIFKDLKPVSLTALSSIMLVVKADHGAKSLADLVKEAKANPGKVNIGIPGLGSSNHMALEQFKRMADVNVQTVPFPGNAPQITALLGGVISVAFDTYSTSLPYIQSGQLRSLAVTGKKRSVFLPDVPTIAEQGYPGYELTYFNGIYAPAGTPDDIVAKLSEAFDKTVNDPQVKEKLLGLGFELAGGKPQAMDEFARKEDAFWSKFIADNNLKMQ